MSETQKEEPAKPAAEAAEPKRKLTPVDVVVACCGVGKSVAQQRVAGMKEPQQLVEAYQALPDESAKQKLNELLQQPPKKREVKRG